MLVWLLRLLHGTNVFSMQFELQPKFNQYCIINVYIDAIKLNKQGVTLVFEYLHHNNASEPVDILFTS